MADFLAELLGQSTESLPNYVWAKGKEKTIWKKFTQEMLTAKYIKWINVNEESNVDNPPMQGYWVGYQICKAYYEKAPDKHKAVYDMLHIQDYKRFLKESGWEEKIENFK